MNINEDDYKFEYSDKFDHITFQNVEKEDFYKMCSVSGFIGYIRDGTYWVGYKWMEEHGFEN